MSAETLRRAANIMRETHRQDVNREAETFLAVADWLDDIGKQSAANLRQVVAVFGIKHGPDFAKEIDPHALAVARAYLGES